MRIIKNIFVIILIIICFFGIFFIGLLMHEATHIIQSGNPKALCYQFGSNVITYVSHDVDKTTNKLCDWSYFYDKECKSYEEKENWGKWEAYTEKTAYIVQEIGYYSIFTFFGFILGILLYQYIE